MPGVTPAQARELAGPSSQLALEELRELLLSNPPQVGAT